jgi:heme/copper-type cytochrome/quinol oxidase subunit 2
MVEMVTLTVKGRYVCLRWLQPMLRLRKLTALLMLLAAVFARSPLASACAVCLAGADGSTTDAYNWSVLFLMVTPYLVMGSVAGYLVYAYRRHAGKNEEEPTVTEAVHLSLDQKESGR